MTPSTSIVYLPDVAGVGLKSLSVHVAPSWIIEYSLSDRVISLSSKYHVIELGASFLSNSATKLTGSFSIQVVSFRSCVILGGLSKIRSHIYKMMPRLYYIIISVM